MAGKYTFDTFVEDEKNKMAYLACMLFNKDPENCYNPLYIWGKHGVGKTHLLYAIQNKFRQDENDINVIYVDGAWFVKEVVTGIRFNSMKQFRNKFRTADILLVDNIQDILGKKSSEEEFFHTFDCLKDKGSQIVITANKLPKDFKGINEKLKSRLSSGLIIDIDEQDHNEKSKIINMIGKRNQVILSNELCNYIAIKYGNSLSEVNDLFLKLEYTDRVTKEFIDAEFVDVNSIREKKISSNTIIKFVAKHYKITENDIISNSRSKEILNARQVAMFLCKEIRGENFSSLGTAFGKSHSTIKNGIDKISILMKEDSSIREELNCIIEQLNNQVDLLDNK